MKKLVIIALLLMPAITAAEEGELCKDLSSAAEWHIMAEKYPNDDEIQRLHALRIGLCKKILEENFPEERAADIFEKEREELIQDRAKNAGIIPSNF